MSPGLWLNLKMVYDLQAVKRKIGRPLNDTPCKIAAEPSREISPLSETARRGTCKTRQAAETP
jgi:hypothetical protein